MVEPCPLVLPARRHLQSKVRFAHGHRVLESPLRGHEIRLLFPLNLVPHDASRNRSGNLQQSRAHIADEFAVGDAEEAGLYGLPLVYRVRLAFSWYAPRTQTRDLGLRVEINAHHAAILALGAQNPHDLALQIPDAPVRQDGD